MKLREMGIPTAPMYPKQKIRLGLSSVQALKKLKINYCPETLDECVALNEMKPEPYDKTRSFFLQLAMYQPDLLEFLHKNDVEIIFTDEDVILKENSRVLLEDDAEGSSTCQKVEIVKNKKTGEIQYIPLQPIIIIRGFPNPKNEHQQAVFLHEFGHCKEDVAKEQKRTLKDYVPLEEDEKYVYYVQREKKEIKPGYVETNDIYKLYGTEKRAEHFRQRKPLPHSKIFELVKR